MNMFTPGRREGLTPSLSRKLFHSSPAIPTSIGPTPQRDGLVLGLFDSLPFKDADIDSPSKPNGAVRLSEVIEAGKKVMEAQQTPRRTSKLSEGLNFLGRTPSSRHKRQGGSTPRNSLLATPLKLDGANRVAKTPGSSASRLQFQTPAFLRRIPMPKIDEKTGEYISPELKRRLPPKPLLRGLSSVVRELRQMQEEELDEELEALREAEMEMEGGGGPSKPVNRTILSDKTNLSTTTKVPVKTQDGASILEEDSEKQALNLLGGFDNESDYDSAGEKDAGLDRNGNPLRVFKKKGQKRTTRKSNMKPVMKRRAMTAVTTGDGADDDDDDDDGENEVPTTRRTRTAKADGGEQDQNEEENDDDDNPNSGSEFAGSDDEDELGLDNTTSTKGKGKGRKPPAKNPAAATKTAPAAKKAPRKVNEHAHANFKRLKLRNSGAKGGPGYNSRFKRRR